MNEDYEKLKDSVIAIASEFYRLQRVFKKAVSKLSAEERDKYNSQFAWFSKRVIKALDVSGLRMMDADGQAYDPGMAVIPLNLEEFSTEDLLYVVQTVEPVIMQEDKVLKTGTVILGRRLE
jgi:hypothetical protein